MRLILARHGETELNLQKKFYGLLDCPLDETGLKQADHLAQTIQEHQLTFDVGYCSGLNRTLQTIKPCLPETTPIIQLAGLNEKGFGEWEGLDADEIEAKYPVEWQKWLNQPFDFVPPAAEDFYQFKDHVKNAINQIISQTKLQNQSNVLLVAHLGTLRVIDQYLLHDQDEFWNIHFDAGCYTELQTDNNQNFTLVKRNVG